MQVIQTRLRHKDTVLITFLPVDNRVRIGTVLSLKGDRRKWTVEKQYMAQATSEINRVWGLDLPKNQRTER